MAQAFRIDWDGHDYDQQIINSRNYRDIETWVQRIVARDGAYIGRVTAGDKTKPVAGHPDLLPAIASYNFRLYVPDGRTVTLENQHTPRTLPNLDLNYPNWDGWKITESSPENSTCLIHSFLTAISPTFRKCERPQKDYIADYFRYHIFPRIAVKPAAISLFQNDSLLTPIYKTLLLEIVTQSEYLSNYHVTLLSGWYGIHIGIVEPSGIIDSSPLIVNNEANWILIYNPGQGHFEAIKTNTGDFITSGSIAAGSGPGAVINRGPVANYFYIKGKEREGRQARGYPEQTLQPVVSNNQMIRLYADAAHIPFEEMRNRIMAARAREAAAAAGAPMPSAPAPAPAAPVVSPEDTAAFLSDYQQRIDNNDIYTSPPYYQTNNNCTHCVAVFYSYPVASVPFSSSSAAASSSFATTYIAPAAPAPAPAPFNLKKALQELKGFKNTIEKFNEATQIWILNDIAFNKGDNCGYTNKMYYTKFIAQMEKLNLDKKIRQLILGKLDEYKNDDNQPTREQFIRMWAIWFAYKDGHVTTGGARQTHKKQRRLRKTRMRRHTKGS